MPRSSEQKRKILRLAQILQAETDESHMLSTTQLLMRLNNEGIPCERKALYNDISTLKSCGMDVVSVKGRTGGHYVAGRTFELAELKLLVDAVQACRSISGAKSLQLIKKLQSLTGSGNAGKLARQVYVSGRVKSADDGLFTSIDTLYDAIGAGKKISFLYCEYDITKKLQPRRGGERYKVSPQLLCWDDENYYLVAFHPRYNALSHFRVDKMRDIRITNEACEPQKLNAAEYAQRNFGMFAGQPQRVEITLPQKYLGVVIDRFGTGIFVSRAGEGLVAVQLDVAVSPVFFSWVFMLAGARITYPAETAAEYQKMLRDALEQQ